MITKTYILDNLRRLDVCYRSESKPKSAFFYSKLSILELCGWIEMSMDDIITRHCARKVKQPSNIRFVESNIVKRTYGFDYDNHFRMMLIRLIGIINVERLEAEIDETVQVLLKAELTSLKSLRDTLAHTYAKNLPPIDAPSRVRARFEPLYNGLQAYDAALRRW